MDAEILRGRSRAGDLAVAPARRPNKKVLLVDDLITMWLRDGPAAAPNKRTSSWAHDASRLNRHIAPVLGKRDVASLKPADIERAQADIAEGNTAADIHTGARGRAIVRGGRAAARAAITTFAACLAWATSRGMIAANPAAGVRKIAGVKRERFLSEAETGRLLATLDSLESNGRLASTFADAFRLLLLTGARKTEIAALRWDEVDLERGVIRLRQTRAKNGDKAIMLNPAALAIITARPRTSRFVLPSSADANKPIVGLQKPWARLRAAAKLDRPQSRSNDHRLASTTAIAHCLLYHLHRLDAGQPYSFVALLPSC